MLSTLPPKRASSPTPSNPNSILLKVGLNALFLVALGLGAFWVISHRQDIIDRWFLLSYKPSAEIVAMADATTMAGYGRDLFYASDPKVQDKAAFNVSCGDLGEHGSVLGCYAGQKIYLYNVTDEHLPRVKEVTAAHEMLHAAYERLSYAEKQEVDRMVTDAAQGYASDTELQKVIDLYRQSEPNDIPNELHSILGTEYASLPDELETYYKKYFGDRSVVVGFAQGYKGVFAASKARIENMDKQLASLEDQIKTKESQLKERRQQLEADSAELDQLRSSNVSAYNQQVPGYNAKVRGYNDEIAVYKSLVAQYNELVVARNQEVAAQNDLYNSLDSQYEPVQSQ